MLTYKKVYNLYSLRNIWNQLYLLGGAESTPFQSFEYTLLLWKYHLPYCAGKKGYPVFYVFSEEETPVLVFPLFKYFDKKLGFGFLGDVNGCNYCDIVGNKEYLQEAFDVLSQGRASIYRFSKIKEVSETVSFLKGESTSKVTKNVQIRIPGQYADYLQMLSKSVRQNIRTSYNRLEKNGLKCKIIVFQGGTSFDYRPMLDLYVSRHTDRYGVKTGAIKKLALLHYNFSTESFLSLSNALTIALYIGDELAAFMSGLIGINREYAVPRLSIDGNFSFFSPGVLLINETIKYFIENTDIKYLDLSQGEEDYKYKMGGEQHLTYSFEFRK